MLKILLPSIFFVISLTINAEELNNESDNINYIMEVRYSEAVNYGEEMCIHDIDVFDVYFGKKVLQKSNCEQEQTRIVSTIKVFENGTEKVVSSKSESIIKNKPEKTQFIIGKHLENNCLDILKFDPSFKNNNGSYNSNIGIINCDMTIDGGGWTQVSNILNNKTAIEEDQWINVLDKKSTSFGVKYFNTYNPESILFKNNSLSNAYGENDLILIKRLMKSWQWNPSDYNNDKNQTGRFYDASLNKWTDLGIITYSSHNDSPWQESAFSFSKDLENEYSGNPNKRIILGGTFISGDNGSLHNFYGNDESMKSYSWYRKGTASIWMR